MPPANNIRTISDFNGSATGSPTVRSAAVASSSANHLVPSNVGESTNISHQQQPLPFPVCCISKLPNEKLAETLLQRVVREFVPIISRRKYNVASISEMCCCGDGLDAEPTAAGRRRRKRRVMSANILGYNQTSFGGRGANNGNDKTHTIHIRLRHASDHARFMQYEDVAGTLAHELSHCEFGPHNDKFYKLMDEILDEHAALMTSQLRQGGAPMAAFTGTGQTLGSAFVAAGMGSRLGGSSGSIQNVRDARGQRLGGDSVFAIWMTPAEAAVAAAEARRRQQQLRLRGDHCCRPCTINVDDEEDEDITTADTIKKNGRIQAPNRDPFDTSFIQNNNGKKPFDDYVENLRPMSATGSNNRSGKPQAVYIDLTGDADSDNENKVTAKSAILQEWCCNKCTFRNDAGSLACDMCENGRSR